MGSGNTSATTATAGTNDSSWQLPSGVYTGVLGATSIINSYQQGSALQAAGKSARKVADANAKSLELRADQEIVQGEEQSRDFKKKIRKLRGAQRAALGASGVEIDSGSALEVQAQTEEYGTLDALAIKTNAWKKAWGLKVEAGNERYSGEVANNAAQSQASRTYAAGGLDAFRYAYGDIDRKKDTK